MPPVTRQTLTYYAAFFSLGATMASLGPTLPFLASNTGASLSLLGLLFTLRSGGYLAGSLLGGRFYDYLPGHRLLGSAILTGGCCLALLPEIRTFPLVVLIMLAIGLAEATLDVGSNTQLVWAHGPRSSPHLNGIFLSAGIGGILSPLAFSALGGTWGYRVLACLTLPVALWTLLTPAPEPQAHAESRRSEALPLLRFFAYCLLTFIFVGGEVGFSGWIYSYSLALNMGTERSAGVLNAVYWLGVTLGRLAAIFFTTRIKPGRFIIANQVGLLASLVLILLDPASPPLLWAGALGFGLFLAPVFPTLFAYLERRTPITGSTAGILWASGSAGAMFFPWVMGLQMAHSGPVSIMVTLAAGFTLALGMFAWVSKR